MILAVVLILTIVLVTGARVALASVGVVLGRVAMARIAAASAGVAVVLAGAWVAGVAVVLAGAWVAGVAVVLAGVCVAGVGVVPVIGTVSTALVWTAAVVLGSVACVCERRGYGFVDEDVILGIVRDHDVRDKQASSIEVGEMASVFAVLIDDPLRGIE